MEEAETLGTSLGNQRKFSKRKETIVFENYKFQIEEMNKRRILKVRIVPTIKDENQNEN